MAVINLNDFQFLGVSAYAGMHPKFPVDKFLRVFEWTKTPAIALVWGTFGFEPELTKQFCEAFKNQPHLIEIHATNEVGRRNGRLFDGELLPELGIVEYDLAIRRQNRIVKTAYQKRISHIREFCARYCNSNTRIILSVGLEDNLSKVAALYLMDWAREAWARIELVRNPANNGDDIIPAPYRIEVHTCSAAPNGWIFNMDGHSCPEQIPAKMAKTIMRKHRSAVARFLWSAPMQGLYSTSAIAPPPRKRNIKVHPDTIITFNRLLRAI